MLKIVIHHQSSVFRLISLFLFAFLTLIFNSRIFIPVASATYNPLSVPNNKVGIHIISASPEEVDPARQMVNTNGDWGYITVLIESKDRDVNKWQTFFNELRRKHLIPIVRLATAPEGDYWKRPYDKEELAWADFLNNLNWPTKNRYIIVYNEPNHAREWGNTTDPVSYAKVLDDTITALKSKSDDFFILNAGFDASAPQKLPAYMDQVEFMKKMNETIPGIFNRLDGWNSHSYPNPNFSGSPNATGRGSIRTFSWELELLNQLGVEKTLPVFITETGWKHAEGVSLDKSLRPADQVAQDYKQAFEGPWNSNRIVSVTPFLLNYQDSPFDHFSFKKYTGEKQNSQVLGAEFPDYYPQYDVVRNLPKVSGKPIQENKAQLTKGSIFGSIVAGETYVLQLIFKNTGQSIWGESGGVKLVSLEGAGQLGIETVQIPEAQRIEPNQEYPLTIHLRAPESGKFNVKFNLFAGDKQFDSPPIEFTTEVKSPVFIKVNSNLKWKSNFSGEYVLGVLGSMANSVTQSAMKIALSTSGNSDQLETRFLLPDTEYDFTLKKPFYKPKTIHQRVTSGVNVLDFGELQPDLASAVLHPKELWKLLPWSN